MKRWLITDTHFGHHKIIELCGRPVNYEDRLLKGLMAIPEGDTLFHLGDVCLGNDGDLHNTFITPIPCTKVLIRGNHDRKSDSWYIDHGWDVVLKSAVVRVGGHQVFLSHQPLPEQYLWIPQNESKLNYTFNIHGHFHNNDHRALEYDDAAHGYNRLRHLRLACELTHYQPLLLDWVIEHPDKFRIP